MPKSRKSRKKRRPAAKKPEATSPAAVSPQAQEDTLQKPQPSAEEAATPTGAAPDKPPHEPEPRTGEPERRDTPKSRKPRKKRGAAAKKPEATTPAAVSPHVGEAQEDTLGKPQPPSEEAATPAGAEHRNARRRKDPIASKIQQSPEGLLEEHPASASAGWTRRGGTPEDSRTLAELAASVMDAGPDEPPQPPAAMTEEPEPGDEGAETPADAAPDEPPTPADARSRGRWAAVVIVLLLLFLAGGGFLQFGLAGGDPSEDLGAESGSAALPPGGEPPSEGSDAPSSADEPLPAVVSDPTPTPMPTAAPEPAPAAAPAPTIAPAPAPTATPVATVAPVPNSVHVGNLVYSVRTVGAKVRVSVEVYVHDSSHDPVAGATVSGEWTGASGSTSCSTGTTPFCVVETKPLTAPGSVTFAVTGVTSDAAPYDHALNHDADGDSNGTSITVTF